MIQAAPVPPENVVVFQPRFAPRNAGDLLATVAILAGVIVVYALPGMVALFFTERSLILNTLFWAPWILSGLLWVFSLEISPEGIRLRRLIGSPRFIPWKDVESVEEAPPGELVLYGIFVPPLPMRESALALTTRGHYRIRYRGRFCYFPPKDAPGFEAAVARFHSPASRSK